MLLSVVRNHAAGFLADDAGAVTVDWVVLTAAVTGLGIASVAAVRTGTGSLAGDISSSLSAASVAAMGELGAGVRSLIAASEDEYQTFLDATRRRTDNALLNHLAQYIERAPLYFEDRNMRYTGIYIDQYATITDVLNERGVTIPDGSPTVDEFEALYADTYG